MPITSRPAGERRVPGRQASTSGFRSVVLPAPATPDRNRPTPHGHDGLAGFEPCP